MTSTVESVGHYQHKSNALIFRQIIIKGLPLGLGAMAQLSINVSLNALVGRMLGTEQLAATTLAGSVIYATAFACAAGFCGALETILSHSYGRDPYSKLYGVYAQRMTLMLLIIAFFIGPILIFADMGLTAAGQNPGVTRYLGQFCFIAVFAVFPNMMLELIRRYYACQHLNNPLSVNLVVSAAVYPLLVFVCIKLFGFYGAPLSWLLLMLCMPSSLIAYLYFTGKYKQTWGGWSKSALTHWKPLLQLALPSMAMMLSEWVSLEVNCFMANYGTVEEVAAFSVIYQTSGMAWSFASGAFIMAAVVVGNAMGEGQAQLARRSAYLCVLVSALFALINISIFFIFRNQIPRLFSTDEKVRELFVEALPVYLVYHFFDCFQSCMMGVFRGCGMQRVGAICIAVVFSVVGVPSGALLFFFTGLGMKSLWIGPCIGVTLVGAPIYVYMLFWHIKWDEVHVAQEEMPDLGSSEDEALTHASRGSNGGGGRTPPAPRAPSGGHPSHASAGSRHRPPSDFSSAESSQRDDDRSQHDAETECEVANASFVSQLSNYVAQRGVLTLPMLDPPHAAPPPPHSDDVTEKT